MSIQFSKHTRCRQTWDSAEVHPYLLLRLKKHYKIENSYCEFYLNDWNSFSNLHSPHPRNLYMKYEFFLAISLIKS